MSSLVLSGNGIEWKYLWPFNTLWKTHMWEKSCSQVMTKNALSQSDFVFFNYQYLINGVTSDSDFLQVDRHGWKEQGLLMHFWKNSLFEETGYFEPKNSASS